MVVTVLRPFPGCVLRYPENAGSSCTSYSLMVQPIVSLQLNNSFFSYLVHIDCPAVLSVGLTIDCMAPIERVLLTLSQISSWPDPCSDSYSELFQATAFYIRKFPETDRFQNREINAIEVRQSELSRNSAGLTTG